MSKLIYKDFYRYDPVTVPKLLKSSKTIDVLDGLWYTVHGLQEYETTLNTIKQLLAHNSTDVRDSAFLAIAHLTRIHGRFDFSLLALLNGKFNNDHLGMQEDATEVLEDLYIFYTAQQVSDEPLNTLQQEVKAVLDFKNHQDFSQIAHLKSTEYPCVAFLVVTAAGRGEVASHLHEVSNYTGPAFSHPAVQHQLQLFHA